MTSDRGDSIATTLGLDPRFGVRLALGDEAPDLSVAEVARRAACSFATAWQAAQDFKLLRLALP
ncbi:MAG: hypothetical protein H7138_12330 [Myxococcales bacterium]|nr:hypothetical protein [Myxococcales bacterium]